MQPAVYEFRQVTFEFALMHAWPHDDQRLLLILGIRDCVLVILVSYVLFGIFIQFQRGVDEEGPENRRNFSVLTSQFHINA